MKHVPERPKRVALPPIESSVSIAFLLTLHRFLATHMDMRISDVVPFENVEQILDVACGPGSWVLDIAHRHRDINFFGIDRDFDMVQYARTLATSSHRKDVLFAAGDMHALSPLLNNSFDIVHARFLKEAVAMRQWPLLLKGLLRLCRPGGYVILTECDYPMTNSATCHRWFALLEQAISVLGGTPTLFACTEALARNCGWSDVQTIVTPIDLSAETGAHAVICSHIEQLFSISEAFLLHTHVCSKTEAKQLRRDVLLAIYDETFRAVWSITTTVGRRDGPS